MRYIAANEIKGCVLIHNSLNVNYCLKLWLDLYEISKNRPLYFHWRVNNIFNIVNIQE